MKADFLKGMDVEIEDPWNTIETAPKDGDKPEWVLGWFENQLGGDGGFCETTVYCPSTRAWIDSACNECSPTHWMALPQPPKTDKL